MEITVKRKVSPQMKRWDVWKVQLCKVTTLDCGELWAFGRAHVFCTQTLALHYTGIIQTYSNFKHSKHTGSLRTTTLTFNKYTFCPHSVFMCFVWIWEKTAIIFLYSIKRLKTCGYFRDVWLCDRYVSEEPYSSIFRVEQCSEQLHRTELLWQLRLTCNGGGNWLSKFRTSTKLQDAPFCMRRYSKVVIFWYNKNKFVYRIR